ncbi:MAG: radical SAM family heme chaperone HemW [Anaerolineales bacterium]|nr:radical SAM family heme chaperone HemW [Anaerolineales bacterium]
MNYSLYLHIPFCRHRCAYCDFNTYAGREALIPAYVAALGQEIETVALAAPERLQVHTIFFGGGTPSLLRPAQFETILGTIAARFDLVAPEISIEANPGTCPSADLVSLHSLGINRISFGVQSFHPDELRQLERIHGPFDALDAVRAARRAGFGNLSLDLIYGLPEQTLNRWTTTVKQAVALAPEHLSLYALTVEPGTPFGRWADRGLLPLPDPDLAAGMYDWAGNYLLSRGYEQYEISNWAKPDFECRHNLQYWRNLPYLGFGAGAHGYAGGWRVSNALRIRPYMKRLAVSVADLLPFPFSPAMVMRQPVSRQQEMGETMITGLRLTREGISDPVFAARFGVWLADAFGREIQELVRLGLLEWLSPNADKERVLRLTQPGRLLGNQVFLRFVE